MRSGEKKKRYLVSMQNSSILKTINRVDYTAMYEQVQCGFKPQVTLELISNNNLFSSLSWKKVKGIFEENIALNPEFTWDFFPGIPSLIKWFFSIPALSFFFLRPAKTILVPKKKNWRLEIQIHVSERWMSNWSIVSMPVSTFCKIIIVHLF